MFTVYYSCLFSFSAGKKPLLNSELQKSLQNLNRQMAVALFLFFWYVNGLFLMIKKCGILIFV
jgi:hypothetical protein